MFPGERADFFFFIAEKKLTVLNKQINQKLVSKLNLSLLGKKKNLHRDNCIVGNEGMSAARMTDFPLWHFACRIYNYLEDGNWLRREPSLLCPPDDEGFCLLPLAWLSSRRRGRCWTICQLEFKCRAAPGPAAMAAAAL